ncbi:sugar ABC transporter ATP-binding protein [Nocardioides sp. YIM 152315]|uniref:sugar ABC transporter ATP-binding protein n=1 Tax=Nocardioides sp. YIM 152315 TaxID=3031760 RepID=UPI0023DBFFEE|nr:sugar ABC transporter ATP-binding protein [Nocardioides sp. YIM 152315]MDF1602214.1 sugar ABC transporter ATP-binding protein [Nocardioides sp. YIM 152315]
MTDPTQGATHDRATVPPLLQLAGVSKSYGGSLALDGVDFELRAGEVHALLGENGAGKSTLAKIISAATAPDSGSVLVRGEQVDFDKPASASAAGVAMVYQETSLVDAMTVAQNLFLGDAKFFNRLQQLNVDARYLLESHNFHIDPSVLVRGLGAAQKQMVEIARAVNKSATIIIFDEPTASITPEEKQQLFLTMEHLKAKGVGMIFITHNLEEALSHADRITVMRDGVVQLTEDAAKMDRDGIVRQMVGRAVEYAPKVTLRTTASEPTLEIDNLTVAGVVQNMSFSAYPGEVVAIAGLVGAGRTETAMVAYGALKRRRIGGGTVRLNGKAVRFRTPRPAIRSGLAYVSEDRKAYGIFSDQTIDDNIYIGYLGSRRRLPLISTRRRRRSVAEGLVKRFAVRTLDPTKARLVELSGGNQQKVVLAKSLTRKPSAVIFDEPTRGVDVGAIQEIHSFIREYATQGVAVVVISSYLPEVLALGDRILVARNGRVVAEFAGDEATEESIMFAAVH